MSIVISFGKKQFLPQKLTMSQNHYSFARPVPKHESQFRALLRNHLDRIGLVVLQVRVQLLQLERCFLVLRFDPVSDERRRHDVAGETERGVA